MDVTDLIVYTEQSDGSVLMTIDVSFSEALPTVTSSSSSGGSSGSSSEESGEDSGFSSDLVDWTVVNVPITFE